MSSLAVVAHRGKSVGGGLAELREVLARAGHPDPLWYEVPKSRKAPKAVAKAIEKGADLIVVWGGDGTVQRCVDAVVDAGAGRHVQLAIVPAGTANLLAANLSLPDDIEGAVRVALAGTSRSLDVGTVEGEGFVVMAGTGFDALMIRDADRGTKDRLGRLAYVWTGAKNLRNSEVPVRVTVDGERWFEGTASCVLAANVGTVLGGIEAFPQAEPDDGMLEVGLVRARTRWQWMRVLARTVLGQAARSPLVEVTRGSEIRIELDKKMPYQLDGGDRDPTDELRIEVKPRAVRIAVPSP